MHRPQSIPHHDVAERTGIAGLVHRAAQAVRQLASARDAHAGGTAFLMQASADLLARNQELEAANAAQSQEVARLEGCLAQALEDQARINRVSHDAIRQAFNLQRERDQALREREAAREDLQALVEEHRGLTARHEALLQRMGEEAQERRAPAGILADERPRAARLPLSRPLEVVPVAEAAGPQPSFPSRQGGGHDSPVGLEEEDRLLFEKAAAGLGDLARRRRA